MRDVPNAWDNTRLVDGYPGKEVIIARQKGDGWFVGGINAETTQKVKKLNFRFLPVGTQYKLTLIADGVHDKELSVKYLLVDNTSELEVKMLRRGGFAACLFPCQ